MANNFNKWQPLVYALLLAAGLTAGMFLRPATSVQTLVGSQGKIGEILSVIDQTYVDTVNVEQLQDAAIQDLLQGLDPHSVYIPASELEVANEQLEGNFEGIGIEFNIVSDTLMVVAAINGGPSQELGILPGDRIIEVDDKSIANNGITSEKVFKLLRGKGGSIVKVTILRPGEKDPLKFSITRGTIPIFSVDAWRMVTPQTGYIKISRFAEKTHEEFMKAFDELKAKNMQNLILDLRGNPGGYLSAAFQLADEFLDDKKLVVYTEGRNKPRADYRSEREGVFETGKLILILDEGSASASEILAGAIQDWDRGMIVGRRSFGKGLVQEPYELSDGSAIRLTVSRYYTPSGRCIQKDYTDKAAYEADLMRRYENGELETGKPAIADSTPYFTLKLKRKVFGGGGIMPDVFVPLDTTYSTMFLTHVVSKGLLGKFAYDYLDRNRKTITAIPSIEAYVNTFKITEPVMKEFMKFAVSNGVPAPAGNEFARSSNFMALQIKALIARQIWRDNGYYAVMQQNDNSISIALKKLQEEQALLRP